jgi:uncharacterized repeat protein (TIGR03803 family)
VFELTRGSSGAWTETIRHSFPSFAGDGLGPTSTLVWDSAGNLYGTSVGGGTHHTGTAFELTHNFVAEDVLYDFCADSGCSDGGSPYAGLVMDKAGNLYGTGGVAFELSQAATSWDDTVLHHFTCRNGDGCEPLAGLILDVAGDLYGATERGGDHGAGTIYELKHASFRWKEQVLHSFAAFSGDGQVPTVGSLASDDSGSLYGTTGQGGKNACAGVGCGTVFELASDSGHGWKEIVLHSFTGNAAGSGPGAGVVRDEKGNLYGTTIYGGSSSCGCGVVYELAPQADGKWKYTVLHRFSGYDGAQPAANLILDGKGNLYGTTATGGYGGGGVAFEITP